MRAWFVAFAVGVWAVVVAGGSLLFTSVVFCLSFDLSQTNGTLCYITGASLYFDIVAIVGGIPFLMVIDDMVDDPSRLGRPLSTWVACFWMGFTVSVSLLYISNLLPLTVLPIAFIAWLGLGLAWATVFIRQSTTRHPAERNSQISRAANLREILLVPTQSLLRPRLPSELLS